MFDGTLAFYRKTLNGCFQNVVVYRGDHKRQNLIRLDGPSVEVILLR
jgi:hypothetical protein